MSNFREISITDEMDIVMARKAGREMAKEMGYGIVNQTRVTTAISELARNIFRYAGEGSIILKKINIENKKGIEIKAKDNGPGIDNIEKALAGGYSTSGGLGAGLSGTKRLMDDFSLNSIPGKGTEVLVRKWLK